MSKPSSITLQQLKVSLQDEQTKRDALVERGRAAFKLGIEERDCPMGDPSQRKLWTDGYRLEREKFSTMLKRWSA